ncbi:MAG: hypothetical protein H0U95_12275 [Bacteroidetes bacterium]|nr:hypothetical protein [Bacteroidota bacterium]
MNTKRSIQVNKALQEARQLGFTKQLVWVNGVIKKLFSEKLFFKHDFAVVKTYSVNFFNNKKGTISYIVLCDGTLGYLLKDKERQVRKRLLTQ